MLRPEYMKVHLSKFPPNIIEQYKLLEKANDKGYIFIKIIKGMYGLKQAAILAYKKLLLHLQPRGYYPIPGTSGLWRHKTRKTIFCLCVDDFGIKYCNKDDVDH